MNSSLNSVGPPGVHRASSPMLISRRGVMLGAMGIGAGMALGGCAVAPTALVASPTLLEIVGNFAKALLMAELIDLGKRGINDLAGRIAAMMQERADGHPDVDVVINSDVHVRKGSVPGMITTFSMRVQGSDTWSDPQPVLFAANGEPMNLKARAVQAVTATQRRLVDTRVLTPGQAVEYLLPLNGQLTGGSKVNNSYQTLRGMVTLAYYANIQREAVSVTGLAPFNLPQFTATFPVNSDGLLSA